MEIGEEHGIWGGTTSRERVALLRRPRATAAAIDGSAEAA
jgi:hypothetical protein